MSSIFHGVGTLTPKQILALPEHCPHCVVGIWKHTFIFTVRPTVHTNPLRKQRTLFQAEKFENGALRKGWRHNNHMISLTEICSNSNPKWPLIIALSNSSGVRWTKKGLGPKNHELNVLITPFKPWVSVGLLRGDVIGIPSLRARNTRGQKTCLCGFSLALVWMWKKATVKP